MDYDLIVVKTLERVYKNYYYIIRGRNRPFLLCFSTSVTILSGGTSHNGFKRFCEITGAGKTAAVANINDTLFPGIQHMTGFFNPVMDQVLNGRLLDDVVEGTLYFPFTDIGSLRQLF